MAQTWDVTTIYAPPDTGWVLDAGSSSTVSVPLDLCDDTYFFLREQSAPMPELDPQYVSAMGVDGDRMHSARYRNRRISLTLDVKGSSAAQLEAKVKLIEQAVGRINRDAVLSDYGLGGTLKYTAPSGNAATFDVINASVVTETGIGYYAANFTQVALSFECKPFGRGDELVVGSGSTTTLPVLTILADGIPGDVAALGRLVVSEDDADDQATFIWGARCRHYSSAATDALFWPCASTTPLNAGAAAAAGPTGAYGSSSNTIYANALTTTYQDILKSTVSTTYWTHVGRYRVLARVQAKSDNAGDVSVRASYSRGDLTAYTQGAAVETTAGQWVICDLGVVNLPPVITGSQRWEFRLQAASTTAGDDVYANWIWLVPVDEGSGLVGVDTVGATTQIVVDTFEQTSGNLNTKVPAPQQSGSVTWAESTAGDMTINTTADRAERDDVSDSASGGTGTYGYYRNGAFAVVTDALAGQAGSVELRWDGPTGSVTGHGLLLRYTDVDNFLCAVQTSAGGGRFRIIKVVAGEGTLLASHTNYIDGGGLLPPYTTDSGGAYVRILATVTSGGAVTAALWLHNYAGIGEEGYMMSSLTTSDAALNGAGALATGKVGIFDINTTANATVRQFDNFRAYTVTSNAACFASRDLELRHDGVVRQDAAGNVWGELVPEGDLLYVPPSLVEHGENRVTELTMKMSRARLDAAGDTSTDDVSATLYATPRFLQLPD